MNCSCMGSMKADLRIAVSDVDLDLTASSFFDFAVFVVDSLDLKVRPRLTALLYLA